MNTLMYDALIDAGVKKKYARAAAIEAGRNDVRSITFEYAIKELRTEMTAMGAKLRDEIRRLQVQMTGLLLAGITVIIGFIALMS